MSQRIHTRTWRNLIAATAAVLVVAACGTAEDGEPDPGGPVASVESVSIEGPGTVNLVEVGSTHQLEVDVVASGGASTDVEWASSDGSVASVDSSGLVTAEGEGQAQVTATSVVDSDVSDSVTVVVGEVEELMVTSDEDWDPYMLQGRSPDEPVEGTLRYVLREAPAGSVITFADGIDEITIFGVDAEPVGEGDASTYADAHLILRDDVTIRDAEGVTINAVTAYQEGDPGDAITYHSRVLYVPAGVEATLEGVTLQGGGFIVNGGGINNAGTLTLRDSAVTGNHAYSNGGGIYNTGTLTIEGSDISGNFAVTYDDEEDVSILIRGEFDADVAPEDADLNLSDGGFGGAIYNDGGGTVEIVDSTITGNEANFSGGAIYDVGASVSVSGSTVEGNLADPIVSDPARTERTDPGPNYGGGLFTDGDATVSDTDFLDNEAFTFGGGFYLDQDGEAVLDTVFFDGNAADFGGGIFHQYAGDPSNLTPSDPEDSAAVTFGVNTATDMGADYYASDTTADGPETEELVGQSAGDQLPRSGDVPLGR